MRLVTGFGRFWWDFLIGDDWRVAAGVGIALALGGVLVAAADLSDTLICLVSGAAIATVSIASIVRPAKRRARG
jgi:hypothetical protein